MTPIKAGDRVTCLDPEHANRDGHPCYVTSLVVSEVVPHVVGEPEPQALFEGAPFRYHALATLTTLTTLTNDTEWARALPGRLTAFAHGVRVGRSLQTLPKGP